MRDDHRSTGSAQEALCPLHVDAGEQVPLCLRILATTDIHAQFLGHDYVNDHAGPHGGFAGLATLIESARAEAHAAGMACVLLDNGDLLQGTPIGQSLAKAPVDAAHPILSALTDLRYDAMGLGNHDLDFGLDYVNRIAAALRLPVVASNLFFRDPGPLHQTALIHCDVPGTSTPLKVGIVSVLPEKTSVWNHAALLGQAEVLPAAESVKAAADDVRRQGAEIVVLLAHMGIEAETATEKGSNDARHLAALPGVDVMVLGHTHRRLPGADHAGFRNVDTVSGRLGATPSVMAGHDASDLAVIDLELGQARGGPLHVRAHQTSLRQNGPEVAPSPALAALFAPAHLRTRETLARPCGQTTRHLHNYFTLAVPTATCALVANAKHLAVTEAIAGSPLEGLPVLASAAAHTAGGRGGPAHYLDIPAGPVFERHLAGLNPFPNAICGLRMTGADLRRWLERAAEVYGPLTPGITDQPLQQPSRPTFDHDTIYGLSYGVDPTREIGNRILELCHEGRAVTLQDTFLLATNSFRAAGGGGGQAFGPDQIVCRSDMDLSTALGQTVATGKFAFPLDSQPWQITCQAGTGVVLRTSPRAAAHLGDIAHMSPHDRGLDAKGFANIALRL